MRKLIALAVLFVLGMAANVYAGGITQVGDATTPFRITATVYNDSGSALSSGQVVVWDNDDTEFDRSGYPYVTTTTSADDSWVAGVVLSNSIAAGDVGDIVIYGPAITLMAETTDASTEDLLVGTANGIAGMAGDYTVAADSCALGTFIEDRDVDSGSASTLDGQRSWVFVNVNCQ